MSRSKLLTTLLVVLAAAGLLSGGTAVAVPVLGVRDIDWHNATFTVPPLGPCPQQSVPFSDGAGEAGDSVYRFAPNRDVVYADVTGEGVEDALIMMDCGPRDSEYTSGLIAMTTDAQNAPQPLATVVNPDVWTKVPVDFTVWYGDIAIRMTDYDTGDNWNEYYRWASSAKAFVRIDNS